MSTRFQLLVVALVAFLFGALLAQNLPYAAAQEKPAAKTPTWLHGMTIKSRPEFVERFGDPGAKKYGIEVYKDENNGNLIYISETGSIAVVPGPK
ncbi:MAG: hypothetical protein ACJ8F7_22955 [Gemmataceae bacterium]